MRISDWSSDVCSSDLSDPARCGQCDICLDPPAAEDATEAAQKALAAVQRLGQRFGRNRVIDHLIGKDKRSEEHTSELQSLMRISYAVCCLKKKNELQKLTRHHL